MPSTVFQRCKQGLSQESKHYSDIPYDSALIELINDNSYAKHQIIIAYELGRRKGLLDSKENYITVSCKENNHSVCYNRHGRCNCKCH